MIKLNNPKLDGQTGQTDCFLTNHENSEAFIFLRFAVAKPGVGVGRTAPGGFHDGSAAPGFSKDWR